MPKQKFAVIIALALTFIFTSRISYAALTFGSNAINTDSTISFSGGNVGIGTASPHTPFDVQYTALPFADGLAYGNQTLALTVDPSNTHPLGSLEDFAPSITMTGSANVGSALVSNYQLTHNGTGTITGAFNIIASGDNTSTGTITNFYDLAINEVSNTGGGTIGTQYGIDISDLTSATNNYAIKTGLGQVKFGDTLAVGPEESTLVAGVQGWQNRHQVFITSDINDGLVIESQDASEGLNVVNEGTNPVGIVAEAITNVPGGQVAGLIAQARVSDSSVTASRLMGVSIGPVVYNGGGATTVIGLNVDGQTGGTNNYAIKTSTGKVQFGDVMQTTATTFSGLPTCNSGNEGAMRAVTDSTSNVWGATITGSAGNHVLAYCDGTNWTVMGK